MVLALAHLEKELNRWRKGERHGCFDARANVGVGFALCLSIARSSCYILEKNKNWKKLSFWRTATVFRCLLKPDSCNVYEIVTLYYSCLAFKLKRSRWFALVLPTWTRRKTGLHKYIDGIYNLCKVELLKRIAFSKGGSHKLLFCMRWQNYHFENVRIYGWILVNDTLTTMRQLIFIMYDRNQVTHLFFSWNQSHVVIIYEIHTYISWFILVSSFSCNILCNSTWLSDLCPTSPRRLFHC